MASTEQHFEFGLVFDLFTVALDSLSNELAVHQYQLEPYLAVGALDDVPCAGILAQLYIS